MELPESMGIFKVSNYEFCRNNTNSDGMEVIKIRVKKNMANPQSKFLAIPEADKLGWIKQAKNEFVGEGSTEEEALNACLEKIKDFSVEEIFPQK